MPMSSSPPSTSGPHDMDQRKALVDALIQPPRNPARMPEGVEQFAMDATVNPLWDVAKGVGAVASGAGLGAPEVGAGIFGAMGLMSPGARLTKPMAQGIRAYHGSPYKFDKFSLDKIGTGEGAQAYGHGLYFAENPAVAQSYKITPNQKTMGPAAEWVGRAGGDWEKALKMFDDWTSDLSSSGFPRTEAQAIIRADLVKGNTPGHMYEVNIRANPEQFLDWDRPLSGQPESVRRGLSELRAVHQIPPKNNVGAETTGGQLVDFLERRFAGDKVAPSSEFREAGIPGIKYLDQGSRWDPARANAELAELKADYAKWQKRPDATPELLASFEKRIGEVEGQINNPRSSNYVVFDDSLIDILKRYGIAGMGLSGLVAANQGDFGYQPKAPLNEMAYQ
jgi:hypothetical protein